MNSQSQKIRSQENQMESQNMIMDQDQTSNKMEKMRIQIVIMTCLALKINKKILAQILMMMMKEKLVYKNKKEMQLKIN